MLIKSGVKPCFIASEKNADAIMSILRKVRNESYILYVTENRITSDVEFFHLY